MGSLICSRSISSHAFCICSQSTSSDLTTLGKATTFEFRRYHASSMGFRSGEEGDGQEFQFPFRLSLLSQRQRNARRAPGGWGGRLTFFSVGTSTVLLILFRYVVQVCSVSTQIESYLQSRGDVVPGFFRRRRHFFSAVRLVHFPLARALKNSKASTTKTYSLYCFLSTEL